MGGLSSRSNSNIVQMRRSTNKKGKQAPAPPKRTRYFIIFKHCTRIIFKYNKIKLYIFYDSLLSSCSSFRDSAYQEQDQQSIEVSTMTLDDGTDLNGIDKIFEGISLY